MGISTGRQVWDRSVHGAQNEADAMVRLGPKFDQRSTAFVVSAALAFGVSAWLLVGRDRSARVSRARHACWSAMLDAGYTSVHVGRMFGRDHTTILDGAKRFRDESRFDQGYAKRAQEVFA